MDADFSGYATKAGLKCSDGRTIQPEAFKHMDGQTVPLVWQHGHKDPANVLGHARLEARDDGVYAYGYFNDTEGGQKARELVQHKDIVSLSIYANQLVERSKKVFHGFIREVSLVLSGANPGAVIDNVAIKHSDGEIQELDDEAVIYTGLEFAHADTAVVEETVEEVVEETNEAQRIYDTMSPEQQQLVDAILDDGGDNVEHAAGDDRTIQDVYDSMTDEQKTVVHYMIGAALEQAQAEASHSDDNDDDLTHEEGNEEMTRNVFEQNNNGVTGDKHELSHEDVQGIVADATRRGSLKDAVEHYALQHGIENIDVLFPDARAIDDTPEFVKRRTEWVAGVLSGVRSSPFSRIKTRSADLTFDDARAKGYIKGNLKKEEFFNVSKRTTTPTTIYKKQKLDRDDILDITDFDVVVWMKGEMRIMLEEELARAILIGDGRDVDNQDKIKDPAAATDGAGIRSILHDHELYVTHVNVGLDDENPDYNTIVEEVMRARRFYKGSGTPTFYTTVVNATEMLLAKDQFGRRRYNNRTELANALGVANVVDVEVMESEPDLVGIIVNLQDYVVGADRGGDISLFDDFDIDYNEYKYLMETRVSGALTKVKSAMVIHRQASGDVLVTPVEPAFDGNTITIPTTAHVTYSADGEEQTDGASVTVDPGETVVVTAAADSGYYFRTNENDQWSFTNDA